MHLLKTGRAQDSKWSAKKTVNCRKRCMHIEWRAVGLSPILQTTQKLLSIEEGKSARKRGKCLKLTKLKQFQLLFSNHKKKRFTVPVRTLSGVTVTENTFQQVTWKSLLSTEKVGFDHIKAPEVRKETFAQGRKIVAWTKFEAHFHWKKTYLNVFSVIRKCFQHQKCFGNHLARFVTAHH